MKSAKCVLLSLSRDRVTVIQKSHKLQILVRFQVPQPVFTKAKMKLTDSRGPNIDTQKCVEQVGGNRFDLVLIATVRARELSRRHKAAGHTTQVNSPVSALLDIQEGKMGREYLKKVD